MTPSVFHNLLEIFTTSSHTLKIMHSSSFIAIMLLSAAAAVSALPQAYTSSKNSTSTSTNSTDRPIGNVINPTFAQIKHAESFLDEMLNGAHDSSPSPASIATITPSIDTVPEPDNDIVTVLQKRKGPSLHGVVCTIFFPFCKDRQNQGLSSKARRRDLEFAEAEAEAEAGEPAVFEKLVHEEEEEEEEKQVLEERGLSDNEAKAALMHYLYPSDPKYKDPRPS